MNENINNLRLNHEGANRQKQGISSFQKHDTCLIFKKLDLKPLTIFLDIGCGAGDYAMHALEFLKGKGFVYVVDQWEEVTEKAKKRAFSRGFKNIAGISCDISKSLFLPDNTADVCLISMVIHGIDLDKNGKILFGNISRVLKPDGKLFIIECKKQETISGPPLEIRLSEKEIAGYASNHFKQTGYTDLNCSYMIEFKNIRLEK
jgi:ubiquinone/menaquinone biosynthesis C-methylase UbiE